MKVKLMKYLCGLSQAALKTTLSNFIHSKYDNVIETEAFLFAEGDIPICLVAHLDTVFKQPPSEIYYDQEQKVMWSPQGLGADDRAGVYAILEILNCGYRPSVVFTTDEEVGGIGAGELVNDFKDCPFVGLKMIIELDRRGKEDSVFYECDNPDFEKCVAEFGFVPNFGSFSDISIIAPEWGVAAVNLSVGYVDEHTTNERLYTDHLLLTIERIKEILDRADTLQSYAYIPMEAAFDMKCMICSNPLHAYNVNPVQLRGMSFCVCNNCYQHYYKKIKV